MKLVISLLASMVICGTLSKAHADTAVDDFSVRVNTAVTEKSKDKLLACFNFEGIDKEGRATITKIVDDILTWEVATVAVNSFDESKQEEWNQAKPDTNGRPMADISITKKNDGEPKVYSMVAGTSPKGFLILLSSRKINSKPKE